MHRCIVPDYICVYTILVSSIGECYYSYMFSGISRGIYCVLGFTTPTLMKWLNILILLSTALFIQLCVLHGYKRALPSIFTCAKAYNCTSILYCTLLLSWYPRA